MSSNHDNVKVYCSQCVYFYDALSYQDKYLCRHPSNIVYIDNPIRQVIECKETCIILNKNNLCVNFKGITNE